MSYSPLDDRPDPSGECLEAVKEFLSERAEAFIDDWMDEHYPAKNDREQRGNDEAVYKLTTKLIRAMLQNG